MAESNREEIAKLEMIYANNPGGRVFTHLAEAYRKAGELETARGILEKGIIRHPDYASAHVVLGRVLMDLGVLDAAAGSFRRVLELDPENRVALRTMGDLARQERPEEALSHYRQLQTLDPSDEDLAELITSLDELVRQQAAKETPEAPAAAPATELDGTPAAAPEANAEGTADWSVAEAEIRDELPGDLAELAQEAAPTSAAPETSPAPEAGAEQAPEPLTASQSFSPLPEPMAAEAPFSVPPAAEFPVSETEPVEPAALEGQIDPITEVFTGEITEALTEQILPLEAQKIDPGEGPWFTDVDLTAGAEEAAATEQSASTEGQGEPEFSADLIAEFTQVASQPAPTFEELLSTNLTAAAPPSAPAESQGNDVPTETLAELYRTQGFYDRSAEIYRVLLQHRPDDQRLRQRLHEVEELERSARVEPVSGLTTEAAPSPDLAVFRDVAPIAPLDSKQDRSPAVSQAWVEDVESAWTGGAGAADVADSPYAWELDQEEYDAGPSLADYLASLLAWRPTAPVSEPEPPVPIEALREAEAAAPEADFDQRAPEAPLVMDEQAEWAEAADARTPASETDSEVPEDAWGVATPAELEFVAPDEPAVEAEFEELAVEAPEMVEPLEAWEEAEVAPAGVLDDPWAEEAAAGPEAAAPADSSVNDAFEEWFTSEPAENAPPPAASAEPPPPAERIAPVETALPLDDDSEDESDDDLEMFRSWLQSLKR